ncbi:hypothetical protein ASD19_10090 [Microbacterium sp. Root53]|uniref:DUF4230 domain-containing protein n=1 Tax=Microbacterium sp. Root53 TaxID=1736553 RepID=UPI0006F457DF|nr:DUF4230 domain-containing protein [Microbacterium sp. Root53]KQY96274.1 hypothetical protein ASD19_10090 [Microbacterium sp. Root53]
MADATRPRRRMPAWLAGAIGFVLALVLVVGMVAGVVGGMREGVRDAFLGALLDDLNPFSRSELERSTEPVLTSLRDLARFVAAEAEYEVLVDLESDVEHLPAWLAGERLSLVAHGTVEAFVDFETLDARAIRISPDGDAVTVTVPEPELTEPSIDLDASHVLSHERGLIDRVGDLLAPDTDARQEALAKGRDEIAAAAAESDLAGRAKENTARTLETLLASLGYARVTVEFGPVSPPAR